MIAAFNRFEIKMTMAQAKSASHSGQCDRDVAALCRVPSIVRQLAKLDNLKLRAELSEYGAWDKEELADTEANRLRIVWIAACNIVEENK